MSDVLAKPVVLGAGPVGRSIVAALSARGSSPRVVTRSGTDVPGAGAVRADLADASSARAALDDATVVFQCSQPAYHRWPQEFPGLQRSIVAACEATGAALVAIENLYGYGPTGSPMTEDQPMRPATRKGKVRAQLWAELLEAHRSGRLQVAAIRASDFFGAGVRGSVYGERFFGPLVKGRKAQIMGSLQARHSVTYVDDLAEAAVRLAADPTAWGRAWHAPTAPAITQAELVEVAAAAAGVAASHVVVKPWMLRLAGLFQPAAAEQLEMRYEFESDFLLDSAAFQTRFGQEPTPLDQSLAETVAWYRLVGGAG